MFTFEASHPSVAIDGSDLRFPVRRIWCVARNYADHAREMGADPKREPPFFFAKPADAVVPDGGPVAYPPQTRNLHHEVELVAAIGRGGADIAVAAALDHVFGYAVGIDLTRRDLQAAAREKGQPWEAGKAFDQSAPISALRPAAHIGHPQRGAIWLTVGGVERQRGDLGDMIWSVDEVVSTLSTYVALAPGDLIFTGTPAGVGALAAGDAISCAIAGVGQLAVNIVAPHSGA